MSIKGFFNYAVERETIRLAREKGMPGPWTSDPVLRKYRFCNVFREDDKTTKWIRERITHEAYGGTLLGALIIARWFNRIETLERLMPPANSEAPCFRFNLLFNWDLTEAWKDAMRERLQGINPIVTGAYMIKTPAKMSKLEGLLWCLGKILPDCHHLQSHMMGEETLQGVTEVLKTYPYLGSFMAYEIVTDLRHTPLLANAPDIMSWANPGPGAARGLGRVHYNDPGRYNYNRKSDAAPLIQGMRDLLEMSRYTIYWPATWPRLEMREIEHTLCEYDKYMRARLGQGAPKQLFRGVS